jgi:hypothetical protein
LRTEPTLCCRFETRAAQTIGEALPKRGPRAGVEDDLVAPAARPAAAELDPAELAGFREGSYGATATHLIAICCGNRVDRLCISCGKRVNEK